MWDSSIMVGGASATMAAAAPAAIAELKSLTYLTREHARKDPGRRRRHVACKARMSEPCWWLVCETESTAG